MVFKDYGDRVQMFYASEELCQEHLLVSLEEMDPGFFLLNSFGGLFGGSGIYCPTYSSPLLRGLLAANDSHWVFGGTCWRTHVKCAVNREDENIEWKQDLCDMGNL